MAEQGHPKKAMDVVYSVIHRGDPTAVSEIATAVLDALRAMPVADRMEVMGMVERRASFDGQTFRRCWTEDYS